MKTKKNLPKTIDLTEICKNATEQTCTDSFAPTHLFDLPDEVLIIIFKEIKSPLDQMALLLTCKRAASLFSNIPLNRTLKAVRTRRGRGFIRYQHRHLVVDMANWSNFIPRNTRLCRQCWRWLPRDRTWKDLKTNRDITTLKHVDWMWMVARWKSGRGKICPTCQVFEDFQEGKEFLQPWPESFGRGPVIRQRLLKQ